MDQYSKYLKKVFGVTQDKSGPFLKQIKKYKVIRNAVAHQNSQVKSNDLNRVKDLQHLKIATYSDIHSLTITSPGFLFDLIDLVDKYVQELVSEIDQRWRVIKII